MLFARRAEFLTTASVIVVLVAVLQGAFSWEEWPRVPMGQKQHDSSAVQLQDSNDLSASPQFKRIGAGQQLKESAVRVAQQIKSFVNYLNPSNPPRPGGRAVLPQTVAAQCGEDKVIVTVKRDLFGIGQLIKASDVSLGSCGVTRQDDATQSVIFEARLQECGSTLMMVQDKLVYSFTLTYSPTPNSNLPIVRTNSAKVGIECRYLRLHNVSSNALKPTWVPFTSTKLSEAALDFSLRLMTDDWLTQRTSNVYSLGDVLNIEASIDGTNHMPLRLFVDSCVATMVPDRNASPRYVFIDNSGCLVDAKVSGSGSRFISPRVQNTKLQLRLDAFRFYSDPRSSIYITCHLKVTAASQNVDSVNKACSFTASSSRWSSVDGSDQVCSCCNTGSCGTGAPSRRRRGRGAAGSMVLDWEDDAQVGPLVILDTPKESEAQSLQLEAEDQTAQGFPVEVLVLAGVVAAVALACIAALAAVLYRRLGKPAA